MRIVKALLIAAVAAVIVIVVVGLMLPREARVERSIHIDAPPERVFAQVNDLGTWDAWSPWVAKDSTLETSVSEPTTGVGATSRWTSEASGAGSQTITLSQPHERIETELDFGEMGTATAHFAFAPQDDGTHVTWGFGTSADGILARYFNLMMDGWIGADYEDGLKRLKNHVEALPAPATNTAVANGATTAPAAGTTAAAATMGTAPVAATAP